MGAVKASSLACTASRLVPFHSCGRAIFHRQSDSNNMRYKTLGGTGLLVSEICLGTMTFGGRGFWTAIGTLDQSVADGIVARALDAGVNFIDTADVYSEGLSEEITGRAIVSSGRKRSDIVLATKAMGAMGTGPNDRGT